jgi:hypothetical protein
MLALLAPGPGNNTESPANTAEFGMLPSYVNAPEVQLMLLDAMMRNGAGTGSNMNLGQGPQEEVNLTNEMLMGQGIGSNQGSLNMTSGGNQSGPGLMPPGVGPSIGANNGFIHGQNPTNHVEQASANYGSGFGEVGLLNNSGIDSSQFFVNRLGQDNKLSCRNTAGSASAYVLGNVSEKEPVNGNGNLNVNMNGNVNGNLNGNMNGNVNGNAYGNVNGDPNGNLKGNVNGNRNGKVNVNTVEIWKYAGKCERESERE